jgi:F-type H+-transporting ATPase subunit b
MISIDYTLIIVILNFLLLLILLNKILYKPLSKFLTERQARIASDLSDAQESKTAAEEMLKKQEEELKRTAQEIRKMKEKAKKDAEKIGDGILKQARESEKAILIDTEKQLVSEKQKALQAIESELGDVISTLASKVIGKNIDQNIDASMISRLLQEDRGAE